MHFSMVYRSHPENKIKSDERGEQIYKLHSQHSAHTESTNVGALNNSIILTLDTIIRRIEKKDAID